MSITPESTEKSNSEAPHQSILVVETKVMERLPTGQVTGISKRTTNDIYTFIGKNAADCISQTNSFLQQIRELYDAEQKKSQPNTS